MLQKSKELIDWSEEVVRQCENTYSSSNNKEEFFYFADAALGLSEVIPDNIILAAIAYKEHLNIDDGYGKTKYSLYNQIYCKLMYLCLDGITSGQLYKSHASAKLLNDIAHFKNDEAISYGFQSDLFGPPNMAANEALEKFSNYKFMWDSRQSKHVFVKRTGYENFLKWYFCEEDCACFFEEAAEEFHDKIGLKEIVLYMEMMINLLNNGKDVEKGFIASSINHLSELFNTLRRNLLDVVFEDSSMYKTLIKSINNTVELLEENNSKQYVRDSFYEIVNIAKQCIPTPEMIKDVYNKDGVIIAINNPSLFSGCVGSWYDVYISLEETFQKNIWNV